MTTRVWQISERLCLDVLFTEWDLTREEAHDIFGRLYGQAWEDAGRSAYTPQKLREEWKWRWNSGKSKDWDVVSVPPAARGADYIQQRQEMKDRIVAAAAETGAFNLFTQYNNSAIVLTPRASPFVETGRPKSKKKGGKKGGRKRKSTTAAGSRRAPTAASASTPAPATVAPPPPPPPQATMATPPPPSPDAPIPTTSWEIDIPPQVSSERFDGPVERAAKRRRQGREVVVAAPDASQLVGAYRWPVFSAMGSSTAVDGAVLLGFGEDNEGR